MVLLITKIIKTYLYVNNELSDPRSEVYPLMSSPFPTIFILSLYLYFVNSFGPKWMADKKPFNIDKILIIFNIVQIAVCSFIVIRFLQLCFFRVSWICEPVDYSEDPFALIQIFYAYIYYWLKILDLLDTVFFILRKKFGQITFLHTYHHTGMVLATWVGTKYIGGGHGLFVGFANCIVHAVMYTYYLLAVVDKKYQKMISWKKNITRLQMIQFLFFIIMFGQILFQSDCSYPKWMPVIFITQNIFMLILFGDFYIKTYVKKRKPLPSMEKTTQIKENATDKIQ